MRIVPPLALGLRLPSHRSRSFLASSCAALLVLAAGGPAKAATGTWIIDGSGNWGTGSNWSGGVIPNAVDDVAIFKMNFTAGIANAPIFTLGANRTIGSLQAGDTIPGPFFTDLNFSGNTLIFDVSSGNASASVISNVYMACVVQLNDTLDVSGGGSLIFQNTVSGTGGIHVTTNTTTQFVTASNTYTGATTIDANGTLYLGGSNQLSDSSQLTVNGQLRASVSGVQATDTIGSLAGNGSIQIQNLRLSVGADNAATTFNGSITDSGSSSGFDTMLTKVGNNTFTLAGNNSYTGGTTVAAGRLQIGSATALPSNSRVTVNGGTLGLPAQDFSIGSLAGSGGSVDLMNGVGHTLTVGGDNTSTTYSGSVIGAGGNLTKIGAGTLTIAGSGSSYTGTTSINGGTLQISGTGSLYNSGATAGSIFVNSGGTLLFSRSDTFGNHASASPVALTINQGGLATNNAAVYNTFLNLTMNGGELRAVGGFDSTFPAYQLKGTVTVGGSSPSTMTAPGGVNTFTGIHLGNNTAGGMTTFQVADVTASSAADLTIANALQDGFAVSTGVFVTSGLIKTGPGTLTVTGNNTYTGPTTINVGTLQISGSGSLYSNGTVAGAIAVNSGATLNFARYDAFGNAFATTPVVVTINAGGLVTNGANFNTLVNLQLNGGELRAADSTNSQYPAYQLKGTVTVGGTAASLVSSVGGGFNGIQVGNNTSGGATTFNVADVNGTGSPDLTISAVLQNGRDSGGNLIASGITKTSAGTLELTGANTYTSTTTVNAGVVRFSALNNFGTGNVTLNGGGVQWATGNIADLSLRMNALGASGGTVDTNGNDVTFGTALTGGSGTLTKTGNGTLTFTVANNHLATIVTGGTLRFSAANQFGVTGASLTLNGGAVQWAPGNTANISSNLNPIGPNGGTLDTNGNDVTFLTSISGSGLVTKAGAGTLFWGVPNNHTGGTAITGGFIRVNFEAPLGTGNVTLNGGGLQYGSASTFDVSPRLNPLGVNGGTIDTNGFSVAFGTALTGPGSFTKAGGGTLTLNGTNTHTGGTIVNGGTLQLGSSGTVLPDDRRVTVNTGGTLALGSASETIGSLAGTGGVVNLGNQTLIAGLDNSNTTFAGSIQGTGSFATNGTGILTLTGASTYTGPTVIGGNQSNPNSPYTSGIELGAGSSLYGGGTQPGAITVNAYNRLLLSRSDTFGTTTSNSPVTLAVGQVAVLENLNSFNTISHLTISGGYVFAHGGLSAQYPAYHLKNTVVANGFTNSVIAVDDVGNGFTHIQIGDNTSGGATTFEVDTFPLFIGAALEDSRDGSGNAVPSGLIKTGPGILELTVSPTHLYTGLTSVNQGTLRVDATLTGAVQVNTGGTLSGAGILSAVTVASGGTVAPGTTNGNFTFGQLLSTGNFTASAGSQLALDLGGTLAGRNYDQVQVAGAVSLGGNLQLSLSNGFVPQIGNTFFVMLNDGSDAISGAFANAPGGHFIIPGYDFTVNYAANGDGGGVGNDLSLTLTGVPEPGSAMLLLGGLAVMARRRRS